MSYPNSKTRRGRVQNNGDTCPTITAESNGLCRIEPINAEPTGESRTIKAQYAKTSTANFERTDTYGATGVKEEYRIRKLTPKECWRLMGFDDEDFEKAQSAGISSTQLYKQAGNSIVVDVLYYIFKELYTAMPYLFDGLKVGSYFSGIGAFECALDRIFEDIESGDIGEVNFT